MVSVGVGGELVSELTITNELEQEQLLHREKLLHIFRHFERSILVPQMAHC